MKKFFIIFLILLVPTTVFAKSYVDRQLKETKHNQKYNSVNKHLQDVDINNVFNTRLNIKNIKDPKLIKLTETIPPNDKDFQNKLNIDEEIYKTKIIPALSKKTGSIIPETRAVDFYKVYRIAERLIRANNLNHMNWRVAIRKTPEDVNAYATAANLVKINTALYDSLYTNDDALAYIIAHEMAHLLLNHAQRKDEMQNILTRGQRSIKNQHYYSNPIFASVQLLLTTGTVAYKQHTYSEYRMMEYMADAEGFNLLIKAGFSPDKAIYGLKYLNAQPDSFHFFRTHPMTESRIQSAQENIYFAAPEWIDEGKYNIYTSNVLDCKKSSDFVSIVISKDENAKRYYEPEDLEQKLTRYAYVSYRKGDMKNAVKYFEQLASIKNDYIPYLYLSYANEYLYKSTGDKAYLKKSKYAIKKAAQLNKSDKYVIEQLAL